MRISIGPFSTPYGWPADLDDDGILERLLALNLQREPA
jgi:hypothetical protein